MLVIESIGWSRSVGFVATEIRIRTIEAPEWSGRLLMKPAGEILS